MFTGIIEELGTIKDMPPAGVSGAVSIAASKVLEGTKVGDSIAVNGICLTVTTLSTDGFTADVMPETVRRTSLSILKRGDKVNLERALAVGGRFGGHIVSGHIDGTGNIREYKKEANAIWVTVAAPSDILRLIVEKGSIAIDGISLTVAAVDETSFKVSVIPHTAQETTLTLKRPGDPVNLETDIIGKYVEKLLGGAYIKTEDKGTASGGLTMEMLEGLL
ncbi:MAG: riboflavin synthase [Lachnospiraceae bacterium]|nr:riboflavin synthase [Lachnospiraceae bacterium]